MIRCEHVGLDELDYNYNDLWWYAYVMLWYLSHCNIIHPHNDESGGVAVLSYIG